MKSRFRVSDEPEYVGRCETIYSNPYETILLYGGYRLPQTGLHPDGYPRIAGWSLGDQETVAGPETVQTRPRLPGVRPPEREAMRGINGLFHVLFPCIPSVGIRA